MNEGGWLLLVVGLVVAFLVVRRAISTVPGNQTGAAGAVGTHAPSPNGKQGFDAALTQFQKGDVKSAAITMATAGVGNIVDVALHGPGHSENIPGEIAFCAAHPGSNMDFAFAGGTVACKAGVATSKAPLGTVQNWLVEGSKTTVTQTDADRVMAAALGITVEQEIARRTGAAA